MSGLKNTAKRLANASLGRGYQTNSEKREKKKAKIKAKKDEQFANANMPDEEAIARAERRKAAKRRGSRTNTVLTSGDRLG